MRFEEQAGGSVFLDRDNPTKTRIFHVKDKLPKTLSGDYFDAVSSAILSTLMSTYATTNHPQGTLFFQNAEISEHSYATYYSVTARYGKLERVTGAYQITVEQADERVHVTAGTRVAWYGDADAEVDNEGLIGVDGDEVNGTDIPDGVTTITVNYRHPQLFLTDDYTRKVEPLVGFWNSDTFLNRNPGEVCSLGNQFTQTNTEGSAQYRFKISPNRTNFTVAGITITSKDGDEILSPVYEDDVATNGAGKKKAIRKIVGFEKIGSIGGRARVSFASAFGWGG